MRCPSLALFLGAGCLAVGCEGRRHYEGSPRYLRDSSDVDKEQEGSGVVSNTTNPNCPQSLVDSNPLPTTNYIRPVPPVTPFYQWGANNGYCGEVFLIQASMAHGQWMSQYWARRICGAALQSNPPGKPLKEVLPGEPARGYPKNWVLDMPLQQSGPDGWCQVYSKNASYNAQMLIEDPERLGAVDYAQASRCLTNAQLQVMPFDSRNQQAGMPGIWQFMSWIKNQMIQGYMVNLGVLQNGESDDQYDHEVTVTKIGTNHDAKDATFYPDDVLYFDDHGLITVLKNAKGAFSRFWTNPSIPPGADDRGGRGCVTYEYGYSFNEIAKTREAANGKRTARNAAGTPPLTGMYSIVVPGVKGRTNSGNDGLNPGAASEIKNRAVAVAGILGLCSDARPVQLTIVSTSTRGKANPLDLLAGANYEHPYIGHNDQDSDCTNTQPEPMDITFKVTVSGLTAGKTYGLYEYQQTGITGVGTACALKFPTCGFATASPPANFTSTFNATGPTYSTQVVRPSNLIVAFRAQAAA